MRRENKCKHDPKQYLGMPIGMYHCPECGEMVVAGIEHPKYFLDSIEDEYFIQDEETDGDKNDV